MQENKSGCLFLNTKWPWDPHGSVADMFGFASISQVAGKIVSEMTDNVSGGTLNPTTAYPTVYDESCHS